MPENRLELVISAIDETASATASARANFLSIEEEAARMAASANASIDSMERRLALLGTTGGERVVVERSLEMQRLRGAEAEQLTQLGDQYTKLYNIQQQGHVRNLERRAELAGKTNSERLAIERDIALNKTATDNLLQSYAQNAERIAAARVVLNRPAERDERGRFLPRSADFTAAQQDFRDASAIQSGLRSQISALRPAEDVTEAGLAARQAAAYEKLYSQARSVEATAATRAAGLAAGRAVLPGEAEFQAALKRVQSRDAEIAALEDRGRKASLPRAEYYRQEMQAMLATAGITESSATRIRNSYGSIIKAAEEAGEGGGHFGSSKPIVLGVKDALEGNFRYAEIEGVNFLRTLSGVQLATGATIAGIAGLGVAAAVSFKDLGELGIHLNDVALKTGLSTKEVQAFSFAAGAVGQDISVLDRLMRGLTLAANDNAAAGKNGRQELSLLGVTLRDNSGILKPTGQIVLELADAFNKLPPGLERNAAALELGKRGFADLIPFLSGLRENVDWFNHNGLGVSDENVKRFEQYGEKVKQLEEQWKYAKIQFQEPLADAFSGFLKGLERVQKWFDDHKEYLGVDSDNKIAPPPLPGAIGTAAADQVRKEAFDHFSGEVHDYFGTRDTGPQGAFEAARKARAVLPQEESAIHDRETLVKVEAADAALDAATANKEAASLQATIAQTRLRDQEKIVRETIGNKALPSDADVATLRQLADNAAKAEADKNPRTAAALLPLLQQAEQLKVTEQLDAQRASYNRRRQESEQALARTAERTEQEHQDRLFSAAELGAKQQRDLAIQQLGLIDAQTIRQKIDLEEQKLAIERAYAKESLDIQIHKLESDREFAVRVAKEQAAKLGFHEGQAAYDQAGVADAAKFNDEIQAVKDAAQRKDQIDTQAAANTKTKLLIDENKKVFSAIKSDTDKFYNALFDHTKSLGDVMKEILKSAIETPIKEILSNQTANLLTELFTGQKGSFGPIGSGQGRLGPFGNVLGQLGLGPRILGNEHVASVNLPGHLGDVELIDKYVPVVVMNGDRSTTVGSGLPSLLNGGLDIKDLLPGNDVPSVNSTIKVGEQEITNAIPDVINSHKSLVDAIATYEGYYADNTIAQHNNNPGNIRFGSFASGLGASAGDNGFAHFANAAAGFAAIPKLLQTPGYQHLTLRDAIARWNGQGSNSSAYANQVSQWTGVPLDTLVEDINSSILYGNTVPNPDDTSFLSGPRNPQDPRLLSPSGFDTLSQLFSSAGGDQSGILGGNAYSDNGTFFGAAGLGSDQVLNDLVSAISGAPAYTGRYVDTVSTPGGYASPAFLSSIGLGPGGTSGFAGPVGGSQSGGGLLGGLLKGGFNLDSVYKPYDIPAAIGGGATTSAGISDSLGGGVLGNTAGGIAGFANSAAGALVGASLVIDGLKRKSGVASAIETPVGAGLLGFKFGGLQGAFVGAGIGLAADGTKRGGPLGIIEAGGGGAVAGTALGGPVGGVIGAAVGAGVATIRTLFFETDRHHTKQLVKQIYGMDINDSTADAIIQIAKQKYGGAISIAVRTQEVRDLLKLYAETLGNKKAKDQFVGDTIHGASLIESQGRLQQQAIYDNGEAYAYASPLSTYGGVETSPLSTSARDSGTVTIGSLQVLANGQSASDLLAGQVSRVSTPGFIQSRALSASNASIGRTQQRSLTLAPSALDR